MPSCTLSPDLVNLPSGTSTSLPPKPRKPPVLKRIAFTLPSGPASTLCTDPSLLPSEEKMLRPIMGFLAGAADCLLPDGMVGLFGGSVGFMPVGGVVGAGSGLAAGGVVCVSGAGVCVWAAAESAAALETSAAAPSRRRRESVVMIPSPFVVAAQGTTRHPRKGCARAPRNRLFRPARGALFRAVMSRDVNGHFAAIFRPPRRPNARHLGRVLRNAREPRGSGSGTDGRRACGKCLRGRGRPRAAGLRRAPSCRRASPCRGVRAVHGCQSWRAGARATHAAGGGVGLPARAGWPPRVFPWQPRGWASLEIAADSPGISLDI